jgi:hypothetical protein
MSMRDNTRDIPIPVIKEELGGGYYYRCPVISCSKIVKSEWDYCPYCSQRLDFLNTESAKHKKRG